MQTNNPLHGFTLQHIVELLIEDAGDFAKLAEFLPMRCFMQQPSVKSALSFLRKAEWARQQTEQLFVTQQLHLEPAERRVKPLASQTAKPTKAASSRSTTAPAKSAAAPAKNKPPRSSEPQKVWTGWTVKKS